MATSCKEVPATTRLMGAMLPITWTGVRAVTPLYAGNGNDIMHGGTEGDYLGGGNGSDTMYGEAGSDVLDGGSDGLADYLDGGAGSDVYIFGIGFGGDV